MLFTITAGKHICNSNTQNSLSPHPAITQWRKQPRSTNWHYLNTLGYKLCQSCFLCSSVIPFVMAWSPVAGEHRLSWPGPAQKVPAARYQVCEAAALQQILGHQQWIVSLKKNSCQALLSQSQPWHKPRGQDESWQRGHIWVLRLGISPLWASGETMSKGEPACYI